MASLYGTGNFGESTWPDAAAAGTVVTASAASSITWAVSATARTIHQPSAVSSITFDAAAVANMISSGTANVVITFDAWADATNVLTWPVYHPCQPGVWIPWRTAA